MRGTNFAEISAFLAVAEEASFTNAAKRLGVSVATLSHSVRALEERLGVRLLNRTTRTVAPTDAGEHMMRELRPLLNGLDEVLDSVNAYRDNTSGHLRLSVPPPVAHFLLAPILAGFRADHPDITVEVVVGSQLLDIVAERFDAGVDGRQFVARDMVAVRMTPKLGRAIVASPSYLARFGRPVQPADLLVHNCIRIRLPDKSYVAWNFLRDGQPAEVEVTGSLVVNSPELEIRSAIEGIGIAYSFEPFVAPHLADGRLVSLFDASFLPEHDGFHLYYPSRKQNPAALRALIEFLRRRKVGTAEMALSATA
jgi:DNA-binding transcriptional LysR family regulator